MIIIVTCRDWLWVAINGWFELYKVSTNIVGAWVLSEDWCAKVVVMLYSGHLGTI